MYYLLLLMSAAAFISVSAALQSCETLDQIAADSRPPNNSQLGSGTFALASAPLSCEGIATQWRVCYYKSTTDVTYTTTSFYVYRPMSPPTYTAVGSTVWQIRFGSDSTYSCSNVSTGTTFTVKPGDIIIVCILNGTNGQLGAAAAIPGASVLHNKEPCTTLPTTIDLSNGFVSQPDLALLVSLDIMGCDKNGYLLDSNRLNCTSSVASGTSSTRASAVQYTPTTTEHAAKQNIPVIVASVVIIIGLVAMVMATVVIVLVLCHIKKRRNSKPAAAALDNMVYRTSVKTTTNNTSNAQETTQTSSTTYEQVEIVYQTLEGGANTYAVLCQQVVHEATKMYEDPYYLPSLHEEELYAQLENHEIKKIPRHEIKTTVMLGSGQFGDVEIGIWNSCGKRSEVAIKTLNPSSTKPEDKVKFLQEAAIMAQFKHPNVIQLYGIVTDGEPIMLVLELAHNKDLQSHVYSLKPKQLVQPDLPKILLAYSKQVALGMLYLSSKSFVHCDLAARNVLVTKDYICKIADFGLSHKLANDNYYVTEGGVIPVKWTAPEAINFKKYSTASDVWSYGCLLYEMWTLGCKPFEQLSNPEAIEKIEEGYRLPPPPGCPLIIYQTMINCWNPEALNRPSFKEINATLSLHESVVLLVPNEALLSHPQAGLLGAPLQAGNNMYPDLQKYYA